MAAPQANPAQAAAQPAVAAPAAMAPAPSPLLPIVSPETVVAQKAASKEVKRMMFNTLIGLGLGVGVAFLKHSVPDAVNVSDYLNFLGHVNRSTRTLGVALMDAVYTKVGNLMDNYYADSLGEESTIDLSDHAWETGEGPVRGYLARMLPVLIESEVEETNALAAAGSARAAQANANVISVTPGVRAGPLFPDPTPRTTASTSTSGDMDSYRSVHMSKEDKQTKRIEMGFQAFLDAGGTHRSAQLRPNDATLKEFTELPQTSARPYVLPESDTMLTKFKATAPVASHSANTPRATKCKMALQTGLIALMELFCVICPPGFNTDPSVDVPCVRALDADGVMVFVPGFLVLTVLDQFYSDLFDNFDAYPSAYVPYVVRQIWDDLKTALATRDSFGPRTLTRAIIHARTLEGFKNLVNNAVPNHAQPDVSTSSTAAPTGASGAARSNNRQDRGDLKDRGDRSKERRDRTGLISADKGRAPPNYCFKFWETAECEARNKGTCEYMHVTRADFVARKRARK